MLYINAGVLVRACEPTQHMSLVLCETAGEKEFEDQARRTRRGIFKTRVFSARGEAVILLRAALFRSAAQPVAPAVSFLQKQSGG